MASSHTSAKALLNSSGRRVIVYSTNGCHKCNTLKEWLKTSNTIFEERDLENVDVMSELVMRNIVVLSAPVLEVDDAVYPETQLFSGDALTVSKLHEILEGNGYGQR